MLLIQEMNNLIAEEDHKYFEAYLIGYETFYLLYDGNQMSITYADFRMCIK